MASWAMPGKKQDLNRLFWSHVQIMGPDECWEWQGTVKNSGYGDFKTTKYRNQSFPRMAHRVAWWLTFGSIVRKMLIMHRCDNKRCCNPKHLFIGTQAMNMRDASAKGRLQKPHAKKSHCSRGHEYNSANTRIETNGYRKCRICDALIHRLKRSKRGMDAPSGG
jgi:hypothetical protein